MAAIPSSPSGKTINIGWTAWPTSFALLSMQRLLRAWAGPGSTRVVLPRYCWPPDTSGTSAVSATADAGLPRRAYANGQPLGETGAPGQATAPGHGACEVGERMLEL